jgi:ABC-type glycerol-3-phosphate transport system permease component
VFWGRNFLYAFFVTGLLVPVLGLLIPLYIQFHLLDMLDHRYTLLVPYITFNLPTAIYLYDSYMRSVPRSVEEAAFIDGASINQIMRHVMFPMCLPITSTIVVLNFLFNWNEFPFALVLVGQQYHTIPIWLTTFQGEYASNLTGRLTAMLIACVPIIVAYVFLRERMMSGITAGAVKG